MSRASDLENEFQLARLLLIGGGKCGKTHYAVAAANSGYNILYFDGDVAKATISKMVKDKVLSREAADRIFIISVPDKVDNGIGCEMSDTVMEFMANSPIRWHTKEKRIISRTTDRERIETEVWEVRIPKLDGSWIIVIDSWTAFTQSCMNWSAKNKQIDLGAVDAEERKQMRGVYQTANERATILLEVLRCVPCNVIVIGHPFEFVKRSQQKLVPSSDDNQFPTSHRISFSSTHEKFEAQMRRPRLSSARAEFVSLLRSS